VDAGTFTLIGVAPLQQDRTCVSGLSCCFDGIIGTHISSDDHIVVLETCADNADIPRFASQSQQQLWHVEANSNYSTTQTFVTAAGGKYQLCWCAAGFTCSVAEDFRVTLGELTLIGPAPLEQDRTCVSGQTCMVRSLLGEQLTQADRVLVLDTCGVFSVIERFSSGGISHFSQFENMSVGLVGQTGMSMTWGSDTGTASGGIYRLCWCSGSPALTEHLYGNGSVLRDLDLSSVNLCDRAFSSLTHARAAIVPPSDGNASVMSVMTVNFLVDAGSLTVRGVAPLYQDRTCVSGQTCRGISLTGSMN
jgi:hypothetical protein